MKRVVGSIAASALVALSAGCAATAAGSSAGGSGAAAGSGVEVAAHSGLVSNSGETALVGAPAQAVGLAATTASSPAGVQVSGTGVVDGTPDAGLLQLSVHTSAATPGAALGQLSRAANRMLDALHADAVPASQIATSALSLQQDYAGNVPDGYRADESLQVQLGVANSGRVISDVVAAGGPAARVDGFSLDFSRDSQLLAKARAAAYADALAKAQQYAKLAGRPLGSVLDISEQVNLPEYPMTAGMALGAIPTGASAVPVSPGTSQVSVTVTVTWALG